MGEAVLLVAVFWHIVAVQWVGRDDYATLFIIAITSIVIFRPIIQVQQITKRLLSNHFKKDGCIARALRNPGVFSLFCGAAISIFTASIWSFSVKIVTGNDPFLTLLMILVLLLGIRVFASKETIENNDLLGKEESFIEKNVSFATQNYLMPAISVFLITIFLSTVFSLVAAYKTTITFEKDKTEINTVISSAEPYSIPLYDNNSRSRIIPNFSIAAEHSRNSVLNELWKNMSLDEKKNYRAILYIIFLILHLFQSAALFSASSLIIIAARSIKQGEK